MTSHLDVDQLRANHSSLISGMKLFYRRLVELDYLREEEVQFPPHTGKGKVPLAVTSIQSARLTQETEQLLHLLPYITEAGRRLFHSNEQCITLSSRPVSHLQKKDATFEEGERFFGYADEGEMPPLPPWAILLFTGENQSQNVVIYDTRNSMNVHERAKVARLKANSRVFRKDGRALDLRADRAGAGSRSSVSRCADRRLSRELAHAGLDTLAGRRNDLGDRLLASGDRGASLGS